VTISARTRAVSAAKGLTFKRVTDLGAVWTGRGREGNRRGWSKRGQTGKFEERGFRLGQGARSGKKDRRGGLVVVIGGTRTNKR